MYYSSTIFGQILGFIPKSRLKSLVGQHGSDRYVKKMTVWNQLVILLYAQATGKESLREIETGFFMNPNVWSHLVNNRTNIPEVLNITEGRIADIAAGKKIKMDIPQGSILVFDRGYVDLKWWRKLDSDGFFFVTRPRKSLLLIVSGQHSNPKGVILKDEVVWVGDILKADYPKEMRRVGYLNENGEVYEYITNNFKLSGEEIAKIYKERWRIENFFKWIKQNLKIKSFLGTSENAVMSQIWTAMIYYLILSYIKFQTRFDRPLLELTRMVKETLFTRRSIIDLLSLRPTTVSKIIEPDVAQLRLLEV